MATEIYKGDIGTIFRLTLQESGAAIDVSSASVRQILFRKPNGTCVTQSASFTTDGTDGSIEYQSATGDIDTTGLWQMQAKVVMPSGTYQSSVATFRVLASLFP